MGVYFSDSSNKADQYTDTKLDKRGVMLLSRVALGAANESEIFLKQHRRAPEGFDSVIGKRDYPEYVIYDGWLAYPEFAIEYVRQW